MQREASAAAKLTTTRALQNQTLRSNQLKAQEKQNEQAGVNHKALLAALGTLQNRPTNVRPAERNQDTDSGSKAPYIDPVLFSLLQAQDDRSSKVNLLPL